MKLFGWMQNKFNRGQTTNVAHDIIKPKQEFCDGLLMIGTFGLPIKNDEETEFTAEEVGKLQKELTKLVSTKPVAAVDTHLPLDRYLNCPSTLELDRVHKPAAAADDEHIDRTIKAIIGRCKDKKAIDGKKSVSFLFKKFFVCGSGFPAIPSFHDALPETRMEKLLRAMLKNKINNPQASSIQGKVTEDHTGSKWVKTDSEYIVLEI